MRILNTRPAHQAKNLSRLMLESGGTVFHLPLMTIEPIAFEPIKLDDFDVVIFLSVNSCQARLPCLVFQKKGTEGAPGTKIIAIGPATQNALIARGFQNVICPDTFSSEGILEMPLLRDCRDLSIALICGENPKSLLKNNLMARGARVKTLFCYRRKPIIYDMDIIFPQLVKQEINCIVVTSLENFACLMHLFERSSYRAWILDKQLCVINEAMKIEALTAGFQRVIRAENATDTAIQHAIQNY